MELPVEVGHQRGLGGQRRTDPPLDALYEDLTNPGKLFGVEKRAEALIADFKREVSEVKAKTRADSPNAFLYDSGAIGFLYADTSPRRWQRR